MPIQITLRKRGRQDAIDAWADALTEPRTALTAIGELADEHVAERFSTRTDPWGKPWAPTSAATIEIRAKLGRSGSERTLARQHFMRLDSNGRRVAIGLVSGRAFHFGLPNNRIFGRAPAPVPARAILPLQGKRVVLPPEWRAEILASLRDGMRRAVRERGA